MSCICVCSKSEELRAGGFQVLRDYLARDLVRRVQNLGGLSSNFRGTHLF